MSIPIEEDDFLASLTSQLENETQTRPEEHHQEPNDSLTFVEYVCRGDAYTKLNDERVAIFSGLNIAKTKKKSCLKKLRNVCFRRMVHKGRKAVKRFVRFVNNYAHFNAPSIMIPSSFCMVMIGVNKI